MGAHRETSGNGRHIRPRHLKIYRIGLSALLGVLGVATNTKELATGKLTQWGKIAIGGIVFSSIVSLCVQIADAKSAEQKAFEQLSDELKKHDQVLHEIRRTTLLLSSNLKTQVDLSISADDPWLRSFASQIRSVYRISETERESLLLDKDYPALYEMALLVFKGFTIQVYDNSAAIGTGTKGSIRGDLVLWPVVTLGTLLIYYRHSDDTVLFRTDFVRTIFMEDNGKIVSQLDFPGRWVKAELADISCEIAHCRVERVGFQTDTGRTLMVNQLREGGLDSSKFPAYAIAYGDYAARIPEREVWSTSEAIDKN